MRNDVKGISEPLQNLYNYSRERQLSGITYSPSNPYPLHDRPNTPARPALPPGSCPRSGRPFLAGAYACSSRSVTTGTANPEPFACAALRRYG